MSSEVYSKIQRANKEKRRSRIRSMRSTLIGFLFLWIIFSIFMIGFLSYKVFSLQKQIDSINNQETVITENESQKSLDNETSSELLYTDGMDENNLAGLTDTLKVYLTFDDGPSENTEKILKILDDYGIKATFFLQGRQGTSSKELIKEISDEGHTIGIHTYSHLYNKIYESLDLFSEDVENMQSMIEDSTGKRTIFYRFPGGSSNNVAGDKIGDYIKYLNDEGMIYVDWNVESGDAANPSPDVDTLVENVMRDVVKYKTSIVLFHDSVDKNNTVEALPLIIERLREAGAVLLPISEETTYIQHVTANS